MSVKERISAQEIAKYLAYLKFRTKAHNTQIPSLDELAALYGQEADQDVELAEAGMSDYAESLAAEDTK